MHGIGCAVARRSAGPLRLRPAPAAAGHLAVPRKNYIDHGVTDQSSILRFIEDTNEGPIVGEWLRSLPRDCGLDVGSGTGPYGQDLPRGGRLALKGCLDRLGVSPPILALASLAARAGAFGSSLHQH
jgi:hypothetical protein